MKPDCLDDRVCAFRADFSLAVQSEDGATMLAGLRELMEGTRFAAHLFAGESFWSAWVPVSDHDAALALVARLEAVPSRTRHWLRVLVEDERRGDIVLDRTFHPGGEVTEPVPAW
jgi:hypothetical protein